LLTLYNFGFQERNHQILAKTILKLSIVIPIKNAEAYIEETLISICNQKGRFTVELLIEDGLSTDSSMAIVKRVTARPEFKDIEVHINSSADKNMYEALIRGLNKASGDVLAWISGTDFYLPNAFSTVADILEGAPKVDWISGIPMSFNDTGQNVYTKLAIGYNSSLIKQGFYNGQKLHFIQQESCFFRKSLCNKVSLNEIEKYPHAGDQKLWNMFSFEAQLYTVDSFLAGSRSHANRVSSSENYHKEFRVLSQKKSAQSYILAFLQFVATYLFPEKLKKILAPRHFTYKEGHWSLKG
jgi:glycosyltransferase involved in cell wall biosynthesis